MRFYTIGSGSHAHPMTTCPVKPETEMQHLTALSSSLCKRTKFQSIQKQQLKSVIGEPTQLWANNKFAWKKTV